VISIMSEAAQNRGWRRPWLSKIANASRELISDERHRLASIRERSLSDLKQRMRRLAAVLTARNIELDFPPVG
jgi:hypothetical protein